MKRKAAATHVPLTPRFVLIMLAIDFILIIVSALGMIGTISLFTTGLWLCIFITTIAGTFFIAGLVSIAKGIAFLRKQLYMEQVGGIVVGWQKRKQASSSQSEYVTIYHPKISYRFHGEELIHISNSGSSSPKHTKGDTVLLFVDAETGAAYEKGYSAAALLIGIASAVLGGALTAAIWLAYFSGLLV